MISSRDSVIAHTNLLHMACAVSTAQLDIICTQLPAALGVTGAPRTDWLVTEAATMVRGNEYARVHVIAQQAYSYSIIIIIIIIQECHRDASLEQNFRVAISWHFISQYRTMFTYQAAVVKRCWLTQRPPSVSYWQPLSSGRVGEGSDTKSLLLLLL